MGDYAQIPRHKMRIPREYATALVVRNESIGVVSDDPFPMTARSNRMLSDGFWNEIRQEEISKYAFSHVLIWLGMCSVRSQRTRLPRWRASLKQLL